MKTLMQWIYLLLAIIWPDTKHEQKPVPMPTPDNAPVHPVFFKLEEQDRRKRIIATLRNQLKRGSKVWRPRNRRKS